MLRISNSCFRGWLSAVVLLLSWGQAYALTPTVAVGAAHTLVLKSNGALLAFGDDTSGQLGFGRLPYSLQPIQAVEVTQARSVAAGSEHTLVLRSDGTVWAWGDNSAGQLGDGTNFLRSAPAPVLGLTNIVAVAAGGSHSLALKQDGTVWVWGDNSSGQLGDGTTTSHKAPVKIGSLTNVAAIATANDFAASHTVALKHDGTVWAWGENGSGELGDGTTISRSIPAQVPGLTNVAALAVGGGAADGGGGHTVALRKDGSVWAWGNNFTGQLGDGSNVDQHLPVQVKGLAGVRAVSAGYTYSLALKSDGTVWAWGWNGFGALGDGSDTDSNVPKVVPGLIGVAAISSGIVSNFAVMASGAVWSWGDDAYGILGDNTQGEKVTPVPATLLSQVIAMAGGDYHSVFVKQDGTVWSLGYNNKGQLADGSAPARTIPATVPGMDDVLAVATANDSSASHTVALKKDGTVWSWGENSAGELGDGTTITRGKPAIVPGLTGVTALAAGGGAADVGGGHSLALKQDGTVWTWGNNWMGQLGDGSNEDRRTPVQVVGLNDVSTIAAGYAYSLAVKIDGTVWAWGWNGNGTLGDGTEIDRNAPQQVVGLSDIVAVASGSTHNLAAKRDGTVWAWGENAFGRLGDGTTKQRSQPVLVKDLSNAVAVAASSYHSMALRSDGSVLAWGDNSSGQLGDNTDVERHTPVRALGLSNATAIGAGESHSVALRSDGTALTWGGNYAGQRGDGTFAQKLVPALVVNDAADGFLSVIGQAPSRIPADLNVPFFLVSQGVINTTAKVPNATLTANIQYKPADIGKVVSVYVFASIPVAALGAAPSMKRVAEAGRASAAAQDNGFKCVSLQASDKNLNTSSQTMTFLSNVLGAQSGALNIMNSTQISNLKGAEIYVNYSSNPNDAMDTSNWVPVATVPGATTGNGCNVGASISVPIAVTAGWNLLGNPVKQTIAVTNQFGDASKVISVWKWDAQASQWQFFSPELDSTGLKSHAQSQGYGVLSEIYPGEGYWVNTKLATDLGIVVGSAISPLGSANLASGWNLVATASTITARDFNLSLSTTPPTAGHVPINMASLWAWDSVQSKWLFYAPSLEAQGGSALADFIRSQDYEDFVSDGKTLGQGQGFWVRRP